MKKKATDFETVIFGIPKIQNIPEDVLDSIICNLELIVSEIFAEEQKDEHDTN